MSDQEQQKKKVQAHARTEEMEQLALKVLPALIPLMETLSNEQISRELQMPFEEIDMWTRPMMAVDKAYMYAEILLDTKQEVLEGMIEEDAAPLH